MSGKYKIAVLLTCHNRREKTLLCLSYLFSAHIPQGYTIEVFLVDDGSTDGTASSIAEKFPKVKIIQGNGNLFWNQGMRLAWKTAVSKKDYDFYLWLNDDTILDKNAIVDLMRSNAEASIQNGKSAIITAACRINEDVNVFSYGGRTERGPVIPNGKLQNCTYINGNAVLVPREVYNQLGNLSNDYTHGMGDFDYGLRALSNGFKCYTTKNYIATCPKNEGIPAWTNPEIPLRKRRDLFYSPNGLNIKEYMIFRKKFWKFSWGIFVIKAYAKMFFPTFYSRISNR